MFPTSRVNSVFAQNRCNHNTARDKGHAMGGRKIKPVLSQIRKEITCYLDLGSVQLKTVKQRSRLRDKHSSLFSLQYLHAADLRRNPYRQLSLS